MSIMQGRAYLLRMAADVLDDLEKTRIANENRMRSLEQDGFGDLKEVAVLGGIVDALAKLEHEAQLSLQRTVRKHPLGPWVKANVGLGEKQAGRLLAALGDPYWNGLHDRPRTVSELWAFCGYHVLPAGHAPVDTQNCVADGDQSGGDAGQPRPDTHGGPVGVAPSRRRGQRANWSAEAKMRAYLCAESCMKQRNSPYRKVYDDAREHYAEAVHGAPCVRCGPKGKPAEVGSPLSDGHKHARALRKVSKEILKDAWRAAKEWHDSREAETAP
jgi:hypothetical protein